MSDTKFWCNASLRIMDVPERHQEINNVLRVPTHCHASGDSNPEQPGKQWKNSIWFREAPQVPEERELHEHLLWIVEFALPHETFLQRLISDGLELTFICPTAATRTTKGLASIPSTWSCLCDWVSEWKSR